MCTLEIIKFIKCLIKAMILKDYDLLIFRIINLNELMDKQTNKVEVRQIKTVLRKSKIFCNL